MRYEEFDSKICVLGLGYIGLPTASILAVHGFWVVGVDVKLNVIETINNGSVHIHEPGLETMVSAATRSGHLLARAIPEPSDVFIIAVPTPVDGENHADIGAVIAACESIIPVLREGNLVILESTVPPRTTWDVIVPILERSGLVAGLDFQVVHAPERVLPGRIMNELVQNDRVLGGIDHRSAERAQELYRKFVSGKIYLTDATTAEFIKLVENTYRDINIAFANELVRISEKLNINGWEVIDLANKHPRVNILQPGPGVGGHCIPVDPWFIIDCFPEDAPLMRQGRTTNDSMPGYVAGIILQMVKDIHKPVVSILGAAYKANVDDDRESPSYKVMDHLREAGCVIKVHDPYVYPNISLDEAISGSDCLVLLVDHQDYKDLSPEFLAEKVRNKNLFVAIMFNAHDKWAGAGFKVRQLGNKANGVAKKVTNLPGIAGNGSPHN